MAKPDDVDQIVAAWQVQRPDLDASPLHVLSRLTRVSAQLD
ncbi:MarR family transcriptional regulator, partial [Actinomycetota bacterium]|nr:MarR family transcriptional regulator [Actinomycetota bacterium]